MRKRGIVSRIWALLLVGILILENPLPARGQSTGKEPESFANVVVFVQFSTLDSEDESTNFMTHKVQGAETLDYEHRTNTDAALDYWSNDSTASVKTLKNYLDAISYGQFCVENYLPQYDENTGIVTPFVLPENAKSNDATLVSGCIDQLEEQQMITGDTLVDGNGDGVIDNLTIIPYTETRQDNRGDTMYPHKANYGGGNTAGGYAIGCYNVINSIEALGYGEMNQGVICHEFLHSVGFSDLYPYSEEKKYSVGVWDLMAGTSIFMQYPLAYTRSYFGGWLSMDTITEDQVGLTLVPASQSEGNQAFILKSPLSDTEFFVVEYRQQGTQMDGLEYKVPGTGLIVYRVNSGVAGLTNSGSETAIAVLGPETGTVASKMEQLCTAYFAGSEETPASFGSTDLNVTEDTLCFSDGSNSGIALRNISVPGDTLTFDVSFPDVSGESLWTKVSGGKVSSDSVYDLGLTADASGNVYSAYSDENDRLKVFQSTGETWQQLGGDLTEYAYNIDLAMCQDTLCAFYLDSSYKLCMKKWDGSVWSNVIHISDTSSQLYDVTAAGDELYVLYSDSGGINFNYDLKKYDGTNWTKLNITLPSGGYSEPRLGYGGNRLYLGFSEFNTSKNKIYQMDLEKTTPSVSELPSVEKGTAVRFASDGDRTYLVSGGNGAGLNVYQLVDQKWQQLGGQLTGENTIQFDIVLQGGSLFVIGNDQSHKQILAWEWKDGSWNQVGTAVAKQESQDMDVVFYDHTVYVAYTATISDRYVPMVKSHEVEIQPTPLPTAKPTAVPTAKPTVVPTAKPTAVPTAKPTAKPTAVPTAKPTAKPTAVPTAKPTAKPCTGQPFL